MQSCGYHPQGTTNEGTCCTWECDNFYGTHMKYLWSILRDLAQDSAKEQGSTWSPPCWSSSLHRIQVLDLPSKGQLEDEERKIKLLIYGHYMIIQKNGQDPSYNSSL